MDSIIADRILLGTWQFGGDFCYFPRQNALEIVRYAIENGINYFDTAQVYGKGSVEDLLGSLPTAINITTKIPAIKRPDQTAGDIAEYYPLNYISNSFQKSYAKLNHKPIHTVLLHNWSNNWNSHLLQMSELVALRADDLVKYVGISFPDHQIERLNSHTCNLIDVIEAPYNHVNNWILKDLDYYKSFGIKIILRSIFFQGLRITPSAKRLYTTADRRRSYQDDVPFDTKLNLFEIWKDALALNTLITVGVSNVAQLQENLKILNLIANETRYSI